jgi:hypothetical protein
MSFQQQFLRSFLKGFAITSGAISAFGIGSILASYIYYNYNRNHSPPKEVTDNNQELNSHTELSECVSDIEEDDEIKPYDPSGDFFPCQEQYGEAYDYKKFGTPVNVAYHDAVLSRH